MPALELDGLLAVGSRVSAQYPQQILCSANLDINEHNDTIWHIAINT